jgi:hypothetical protein
VNIGQVNYSYLVFILNTKVTIFFIDLQLRACGGLFVNYRFSPQVIKGLLLALLDLFYFYSLFIVVIGCSLYFV